MKQAPLLSLSILAIASTAAAQWDQAPGATNGPAGRIRPAMAFDAQNGNTVLFGGADVGGFPPTSFADTWTWDGIRWTQRSPATTPGGRYYAGMSFDALRNRVVMYGGLSPTFFGANYRDDTWEWDGTDWTQIATANTPGSLIGNPGVGEHAMAFDPIGNRTVMYGGDLFQRIAPSPATLEYDGIDWSLITPAGASPGPRSQVAMCSAPTLGGVLLFGGTNFNNPPGPNGEITWNDLWVYTSGNDTWTPLTPVGALPPARAGASLVFDANRGLYILHGGYLDSPTGAIPLADTWTFDGTSWTDVTVPFGSPTSPRVLFGMSDGPNGCHVLFGGSTNFFGTNYSDTWVQGQCAAVAAFGAGCPGTNGVPSISASVRPVLGTTFMIDAGNLDPTASFAFMVTGFSTTTSANFGPLPFSLQVVGLGAGCDLLVSDDTTELFGVSAGAGTWNLSVPNTAMFIGTLMHHQIGSIDPAAPGGFAVSGALSSLVGL